ncbi:hypothetical protein ACFSL4_04870 [Streptomyces caeni]|uniref:Uncharacterized protein n=1 Tax=Streptomyces caeni TaxID=2307231 RepID=A0ABW4IJS9_9ACTN
MQESDEPSPLGGPIFEQVVDRALGSPEIAAAIGAADTGPWRERLRARALEERERLLGVAAVEHDEYVKALAAAVGRDGPPHADDATRERILPVLAVLVPSLGAVATGVFLLCGFGLRAFAVRPHIGDGLVMAGVIAAAVTAGAAIGDLGWLLVTGARGRARRGAGEAAPGDPEVSRARAAWELAVLERGLVPFLTECAGVGPAGPTLMGAGSMGASPMGAGSMGASPMGASPMVMGPMSPGFMSPGSMSPGSMDLDRGEGDRGDPGNADPQCPDPGRPEDRRQADEARTVGAEERTQ